MWWAIGGIVVWMSVEQGLRIYRDSELSNRLDRLSWRLDDEVRERGRIRKELRQRCHHMRKRIFRATSALGK